MRIFGNMDISDKVVPANWEAIGEMAYARLGSIHTAVLIKHCFSLPSLGHHDKQHKPRVVSK